MADASLNAMRQDRHEADRYRRIELITGTVRRRRWTIDEKAAIVAESTRPGVNIAEVARRFGVNRGLLQTWRRKASVRGRFSFHFAMRAWSRRTIIRTGPTRREASRWRLPPRPAREPSRSKVVAYVCASPGR